MGPPNWHFLSAQGKKATCAKYYWWWLLFPGWGLNPGPLACMANALHLSYIPSHSLLNKGHWESSLKVALTWSGISPHCPVIIEQLTLPLLNRSASIHGLPGS